MTHSRAERLPKIFAEFRRDTGEGEEAVVEERGFVFAQLHFGDALVKLFSGLFLPLRACIQVVSPDGR